MRNEWQRNEFIVGPVTNHCNLFTSVNYLINDNDKSCWVQRREACKPNVGWSLLSGSVFLKYIFYRACKECLSVRSRWYLPCPVWVCRYKWVSMQRWVNNFNTRDKVTDRFVQCWSTCKHHFLMAKKTNLEGRLSSLDQGRETSTSASTIILIKVG